MSKGYYEDLKEVMLPEDYIKMNLEECTSGMNRIGMLYAVS
jgi:hypothetical protein